jgi:hypothetical protein
MISKIMDTMFGCRHSHYSFPLTVRKGRRSQAAALTGTYVACLDCGAELPYDWHAMRVLDAQEPVAVRALVTKEAA